MIEKFVNTGKKVFHKIFMEIILRFSLKKQILEYDVQSVLR